MQCPHCNGRGYFDRRHEDLVDYGDTRVPMTTWERYACPDCVDIDLCPNCTEASKAETCPYCGHTIDWDNPRLYRERKE